MRRSDGVMLQGVAARLSMGVTACRARHGHFTTQALDTVHSSTCTASLCVLYLPV